jgi:hypothetical protein
MQGKPMLAASAFHEIQIFERYIFKNKIGIQLCLCKQNESSYDIKVIVLMAREVNHLEREMGKLSRLTIRTFKV